MLTNCPQPDYLNDIPVSECRFKIEQLQRIYLQRLRDANGNKNVIDTSKYTGTVDVVDDGTGSYSQVNYVSGDEFNVNWQAGRTISIGGTDYTISSVSSTTQLSLNEDLGSSTTGASYNVTVDVTKLATWKTLFNASDSTKVIKTPTIANPESDGGDPITYGGDNSTPNGKDLIVNKNLVSMTASLYNVEQTVVQSMKNVIGEKLGMYLVDRYGRIFGQADDPDNMSMIYPIPISGFFVGDLMPQGLNDPDMNNLQWQFAPNYSDMLYTITPSDFDALKV